MSFFENLVLHLPLWPVSPVGFWVFSPTIACDRFVESPAQFDEATKLGHVATAAKVVHTRKPAGKQSFENADKPGSSFGCENSIKQPHGQMDACRQYSC